MKWEDYQPLVPFAFWLGAEGVGFPIVKPCHDPITTRTLFISREVNYWVRKAAIRAKKNRTHQQNLLKKAALARQEKKAARRCAKKTTISEPTHV